MRDQPRWEKDDPILASQLNAHSDGAAKGNSRVGDDKNIVVTDTPDRQIVGPVKDARPFWATLSGSGPGYSWTKVTLDSSGSWASTTRTGTSNAYEANGRTGLSGKRARLHPDGRGGFVFYAKRCCSAGCSVGSIAFTVTGCSGVAVSGATVSVTGPGGFSASGTTNGSGQVTFSIIGYPAGSYSWTVTYSPRYATASGTRIVSCNSTNATSVSLSAASGYTCMPCCDVPVKNTLNVTTPFGGTGTITYGGLGFPFWAGTIAESLPCRQGAGCTATTGTVSTNVWAVGGGATCSASGFNTSDGYSIGGSPSVEWLCDSGGCTSGASFVFYQVGTASYTCEPFSFSATMYVRYNPNTGVNASIGTITISE